MVQLHIIQLNSTMGTIGGKWTNMNLKTSKRTIIDSGSSQDNPTPTIVFIETAKSGSSREAVRAAHSLGYYTVVLTRQGRNHSEYPEVNQMIRVRELTFDILNKQIKALSNRGKQVKAILSFTEPYVHLAVRLAESSGLNLFTSEAILRMEDKILTREALVNTPYNPYYEVMPNRKQLAGFVDKHVKTGPLLLKSPKSYGSRGVLYAENVEQLQTYANYLFNRYPGLPILVEEFLPGQQYLVEVLVVKNQVNLVAVIEQEITFHKRFIVTGYTMLAESPGGLFDEIHNVVSSIVNELGLTTGACHLELRLVDNNWKLIEANPRISGGAMNRMIRVSTGINLVKETIRAALGEQPNLEKSSSQYVFTQYLTVSSSGILRSVTGRNRASRHPGVTDVFVKYRRGSEIGPPSSMGQRCGYVMAVGTSPEEARNRAKTAAREIRFHLENPGIRGDNIADRRDDAP